MVCAFLPLNLGSCVRPSTHETVDMLHLRRRKTPLCPAPLLGWGCGWSDSYGGIANIGTGLILSAQGQTRLRWLNCGVSSRREGASKLQWMNFFGGRLVLRTRCVQGLSASAIWCRIGRPVGKMGGSPAVPSSWGRDVGPWPTNTIWQGLANANAALDTETVEGLVAGRGPVKDRRARGDARLRVPFSFRVRDSASFWVLGAWDFLGSGQEGDAQSIHQGQERRIPWVRGAKGAKALALVSFCGVASFHPSFPTPLLLCYFRSAD